MSTSYRCALTTLGLAATLSFTACGDDGVSDPVDAATDAVVAIDAAAAPRSIQELQDGTVATGAPVFVDKVFVTARRLTPPGNLLAYVQEPDGVTSGGHPYPEYAGLQLFATTAEVAQFPGLGTMQVGDCISIAGSTLEFENGNTEIVTPTAFMLEPAGSCGTAPRPFVVPTGAIDFGALATDLDPGTAGDQAGAAAERYEGVLVTVNGVTAPAATDPATGEFRVIRTGAPGATLAIGKFVYTNFDPVPATAGQVFASITGVYAQRVSFQLQPRTAADLQ